MKMLSVDKFTVFVSGLIIVLGILFVLVVKRCDFYLCDNVEHFGNLKKLKYGYEYEQREKFKTKFKKTKKKPKEKEKFESDDFDLADEYTKYKESFKPLFNKSSKNTSQSIKKLFALKDKFFEIF